MKGKGLVVVMIASCLFAGSAYCADWKFYGEFTAAPGVKAALFYDSNNVLNTNNSMKLWVRTVLSKDLDQILANKAVKEKAEKKIAAGYTPPIVKEQPNNTTATYLEVAANEPPFKSKAEILYQIVCKERKYRKISGVTFNAKGVADSRFGITKWESIDPESNAEILSKIVCKSK